MKKSVLLTGCFILVSVLHGGTIAQADRIRLNGEIPVPIPDVTPEISIDFKGDNWDTKNITNYDNILKIDFNGTKDGKECLLITKKTGRKQGDTDWGVQSKNIPFSGKKGLYAVTVTAGSNADLRKAYGSGYGSELIWLDKNGVSLGVLPLRFPGNTEKFTEFRTECVVPAGTEAFRIRLGFDTPNIGEKEFFACSGITLSPVRKAPAVASSGFTTGKFRSGNGSVRWNADLPGKSAIRFQVSSAEDVKGKPGKWSAFAGPSGENSFHTSPFTVKGPWVRFKVFFDSDGKNAPLLKEFNVGGCTETRWSFREDTNSPVFVNLTKSPTENPKEVLRFSVSDFSGMDWSTFSAEVDGRDITSKIVRKGNILEYTPETAWKKGIHKITLYITDSAGNRTKSGKVLFLGKKPNVPKTILRYDGIPLVDGKPFFPVGIYDVCRREFNGNSMEKAVADLHAAGFNFIHTYHHRDKEFYKMLDKAKACDMKVWVTPSNPFSDESRKRRPHPAIIGWYLADDTCRHTTPALLQDFHDRMKCLDGNRLSVQADTVHSFEEKSCYEDYVPCTDVFLPEIYTVWQDSEADRNRSVPKTFFELRRCFADIAKYKDLPVKGVWPILQYFKGYPAEGGGWHRFPSKEELRAMTYGVIVQGAGGVTWYTYGGFPNPKTKKQTDFGITATPETWKTITDLTKELALLQPVLVAEKTLPQPVPRVLKGSLRDMYEAPSVTCMLKEADGKVYFIAVNGIREPVEAAFDLPASLTEGTVLFENRSITLKNGILTDKFEPYAVHIYQFSKKKVK